MVTKLEVVYYAKCSDTGEVWESDNFRSLFHCVLHCFKSDMKHCRYYDSRFSALYYGVVLHFNDGSCAYHPYREVCNIFVSGVDGVVHCHIGRD